MTRFLFITGILCGVFLSLGGSPAQAETSQWTYVYYISGDNDYSGAQYDTESKLWKISDQAREFYRAVREQALRDSQNSYAIFFDSNGSSFPIFGSHRTKYAYFRKGKEIATKVKSSHMDPTQPHSFFKFGKRIAMHLPEVQHTPVMFYYYGEHIPGKSGPRYDMSTPGSSNYHIKWFALGLQQFQFSVPIHLLVMQTCFSATDQMLRALYRYGGVPRAILSNEAASRSVPPLPASSPASGEKESIDGFANRWIKQTMEAPFKYHFSYFPDIYALAPHLDELHDVFKNQLAQVPLKNQVVADLLNQALQRPEISSEVIHEHFSHPAYALPFHQEVMLDLTDFLALFMSEQDIERWISALNRLPELGEILVLLPDH